MSKFQPFIKWSGSKRSQSQEILKYFPKKIETYYEPFCGGASMLFALMNSDIEVKNYHISDINEDLYSLLVSLKEQPQLLKENYRKLWNNMFQLKEQLEKQKYFNLIRDTYNNGLKYPWYFLFLNRTCFNGLFRVNKNGEFNVPCGKYKNPTICDSENLRNLSYLIRNVEFQYGDYKKSEKRKCFI
jgi:DNA adenine methylase